MKRGEMEIKWDIFLSPSHFCRNVSVSLRLTFREFKLLNNLINKLQFLLSIFIFISISVIDSQHSITVFHEYINDLYIYYTFY